MKIAYLVNQRTKVSHAFSRREILAMEKEGVEVVRWRIRRSTEPLVDWLDVEGAAKTHGSLDAGRWKMVRGILRVLRTRPGRFLGALRHAVRSGVRSERNILRHLAYLAQACVLVGWADTAAIIKALDESRAVVLPSFAEGLPVVIMAALARARPVCSTFVAGFPELVVPGRKGWLVPAGSADELAAGLHRVLETPVEEPATMRRRGREVVRRLHDITASARELVAQLCAATGAASERPAPASN